MVDYLTESPSYKSSIFKGDEKAIRDFVKLTLGRLVFIQFLQKKRWMGVPTEDSGWNTGDPTFLKNSFHNFTPKDAFYSNFLEPLFFETLNKDGRPNLLFPITGTKVPYLNGGLFEKGKENSHLINFPSAYFDELFEFFDRYNFTIDESDPKEQEVGIDPEMLGHIFENLLEDNKDKGAYYTPKEIVHYMCQESLLEYLKTFLKENGKWPKHEAEQKDLQESLLNFIKKKEGSGIIEYDRELAIALRDVKICDPAIGSGAFPMGLLTEIFQAVYILFHASRDVVGEEWRMKEWKPNLVKRNIIQNSIYGVDMEKGAVDIARLRFWLSLIVEEPKPEPLPNLDYKIVVGNSLIGKLGEIVIDIDWSLDDTSYGLFGAELAQRKAELLNKLSIEQKEFFNPKSNKNKLSTEIRNLKIDLLLIQLELMVKTKGIETKPTGTSRKIAEQTRLYLQTLGWKEGIKQLLLLKKQPEKPLNFFDWKLDFSEVVNESVCSNSGFDIVIGNPPYIKVQNIPKQDALTYKEKYQSATGKYDIYLLFIEHSFEILKKNGSVIFINPHRFIIADYGREIRNVLKEKNWIKSILYFGVNQIFSNATTYSGVFHFKENSNYVEYCEPKTKNLHELKFFEIPYSLLGDTWLITTDSNVIRVLNQIKSYPSILKYCEGIYQGIISIGDKIFMFDGKEVGELINGVSEETNENITIELQAVRPVLKGEDIRRYKPLKKKKYTIFLHEENSKGKTIPIVENDVKTKFPLTYNYLNQFKNELVAKKISYKTNPDYWYSLHRSRELSILNKEGKIITPQLQNKPNFTIDFSGKYYPDAGGYIVAPKKEFQYLSKSLLAVLNSRLFYYFIVNTSTPYNNNYYYFKTNYIEPFCIPENIVKINDLLSKIVTIVLHCNKDFNIDNSIPNSHISEFFEEIIDALILELYFPNEFQLKKISIEESAKTYFQGFENIENLLEEEQIKSIKNMYSILIEKGNLLRNQIKLMKIELKELVLPVLSI
ncbi:Eco57I restriction-modification methylase domain-containing protein [Belliella aquatica]|nr:Eco57I restriction-modification methylase domain-containing protein [Belliella aquatica]MCH7404620.1 Eco57I restriction-modification methylase domain-containing protein [Belliella aquatica]